MIARSEKIHGRQVLIFEEGMFLGLNKDGDRVGFFNSHDHNESPASVPATASAGELINLISTVLRISDKDARDILVRVEIPRK